MRDWPQPAGVPEADSVQDEAFPAVEAEAQVPVLPPQQPVVQRERDAIWLLYLQGADLPKRHRYQLRQVLAHDLGPICAV